MPCGVKPFYREEREIQSQIFELLQIFRLRGAQFNLHVLSYGDQRRLEIVRALATRPSCSCSTSRLQE